MKKICVITGSRAEYGLLQCLMRKIKNSSELDLQIIVTGMHLSPKFGHTYIEIEKDGFQIDHKIEMLLDSDTPVAITKSMGLGFIGFADALFDLNPDLILILGDRFEIFAAASAAMISRIPIAHLHGGESSEGNFDESIRHSITKMSHLHFVAADLYRERVIQLGENPNRVFNVGGLGADSIVNIKMLKRKELEKSIDMKLGKKNLLITFHPTTLEEGTLRKQMNELLSALENKKDVKLLFTMPNSDTESNLIFQMIAKFLNVELR